MSQDNGISGGSTDEVFEEQFFLCGKRASVGVDFEPFNLQDL